MENDEVAKVPDETADMLEVAGENFFRVRTYRNAARAIRDQTAQVADLSQDQIDEIPGVCGELLIYVESQQFASHMAVLCNARTVGGLVRHGERPEVKIRISSGAKSCRDYSTRRGGGAKSQHTLAPSH